MCIEQVAQAVEATVECRRVWLKNKYRPGIDLLSTNAIDCHSLFASFEKRVCRFSSVYYFNQVQACKVARVFLSL